jgi:hypothetical protein
VNRKEAEVPDGNNRGGGLYLYGIKPDDQEQRWSLTGIGGAPLIYTISHNGISAVVSDAAAEISETIQEDLLTHNRVLEQVLQTSSVLPLRLGTVAKNETEVRAFLQKAHRPLCNALEQIAGKVEFDVEVAWNGDAIFRLIAEQDEEIRKYKEQILATGRRPGPDEQMAAGVMVAHAIARQRAEFAKAVEVELQALSERVSSLKSRDQETVFNAAFLVLQERKKAFEEAIYGLGAKHGQLLKFRFAGPLPCYSFVNLQVKMVEFSAVDEARRTLGLAEQTTLGQIKQAFRKLAPECHPDRNSTDPQAKGRFEKLGASYRLLLGLWETIGGDSAEAISLTQKRVGKTMLVISKETRLDSQTGELSKAEANPIGASMSQG